MASILPGSAPLLLLLQLLQLLSCSTSAAAALSDAGGGSAGCDQWSSWQLHSWGSVRRRESCSTGAVAEQCRAAGDDSPTACSGLAPSNWRPTAVQDPRHKGHHFVYYSYYSLYRSRYYTYYNYAYLYVYCGTACIIGSAVGAVVGLGFLIGGLIAIYCIFCRKANQRPVVRPTATTTTVLSPPQTVSVPAGYNNPGFVANNQGTMQVPPPPPYAGYGAGAQAQGGYGAPGQYGAGDYGAGGYGAQQQGPAPYPNAANSNPSGVTVGQPQPVAYPPPVY